MVPGSDALLTLSSWCSREWRVTYLGVVELHCDPLYTHVVNYGDLTSCFHLSQLRPPEDEQLLSTVEALTWIPAFQPQTFAASLFT